MYSYTLEDKKIFSSLNLSYLHCHQKIYICMFVNSISEPCLCSLFAVVTIELCVSG